MQLNTPQAFASRVLLRHSSKATSATLDEILCWKTRRQSAVFCMDDILLRTAGHRGQEGELSPSLILFFKRLRPRSQLVTPSSRPQFGPNSGSFT